MSKIDSPIVNHGDVQLEPADDTLINMHHQCAQVQVDNGPARSKADLEEIKFSPYPKNGAGAEMGLGGGAQEHTRSLQNFMGHHNNDGIGFLSRSQLPSEAFRQSRVLSPTSRNNQISGFKGLRSNFGSQARLLGNQTNGNNCVISALRSTVKVNQIKPPESDEEHYSLDSKELKASPIKTQQKMTTMFMPDRVDKGPISPPAKEQIETPASGFDNQPLLEMPLTEEPMPEQKSIKQSLVQVKPFDAMRTSNDFQIGLLEAPKQPDAHEDPPPGGSNASKSPISATNNPQQDNQDQPGQPQNNTLLANLDAQKAQAIAVDHLQDNLVNAPNEEDQSENSEDVQFPQDVLFTNVNSNNNNQYGGAENQNQRQQYQQNNINSIQEQRLLREPEEFKDVIMPNFGDEQYVELKQQLEDSNVYFLNGLRREIDNEEQFSRLHADVRPDDHDQTSFPCISAIMHQPQANSDKRQVSANNSALFHEESRQQYSFAIHQKQNRFSSIKQNSNNHKIQQNLVSDLSIASKVGSRPWEQRRDDSFLIERVAIEGEFQNGSIAVDSADFGESKLIITEKRHLNYKHQVELRKESVKLQNGKWLQQQIDNAKTNEVIYLQSKTYKFNSLFISGPVTLIGQPETILEVDGGAIYIDFSKNNEADDQGGVQATEEDLEMANTPFAGKEEAHNSSIKTTQDFLKNHPLNRGTPLTIKKSKVARIQICEIRFNRTKASFQSSKLQQQTRQINERRNTEHVPQFSHDISLGATQNAQNQQPSQTMLQFNNTSNHADMNTVNNNTLVANNLAEVSSKVEGPSVSCFVIENNSFVEVKDCCIKSVKDKMHFDQELDTFFKNKTPSSSAFQQQSVSATHVATLINQQSSNMNNQNEKTATNDCIPSDKADFQEQMRKQDNLVRDYCFTLNLAADHDAQGRKQTSPAQQTEYSGLVSLCSTTIQNFMFGVYCGPDAILTCETSSFIGLRAGGCAIKSHSPKLLKVMNGSIQKCEAHGIQVTLDEIKQLPGQQHMSPPMMMPSSQQMKDFGQATTGFGVGGISPFAPNKQQYEVLATEPVDQEGCDVYTAMLQRLTRKVYIENNRIVQVQGCPILVEGPATEHYLQYFIKVKDNRISNCGLDSKLYVIPGATEEEKQMEQVLAKQAYARIGGEPRASIYLRNLHVFDLSCFRNTISKGSGSGITIQNVKGHKEDTSQITCLPTTEQEAQQVYERCVGDEQRVTVIDNYVIEISQGYGMVIDGSTCHMELNQLKKNAYGGLLITTSAKQRQLQALPQFSRNSQRQTTLEKQQLSLNDQNIAVEDAFETARSFANNQDQDRSQVNVAPQASSFKQDKSIGDEKDSLAKQAALRLSQIKNFRSITLDNSTAVSNQKFGIGVLGFYGCVVIKNTQVNENETDGMVFAKSINDPAILNRREQLNDEAQFLDYADCTDRSSKRNVQRSRSPTVIQPTEQAMLEGNLTSYRNDFESPEMRPCDVSMQQVDRPFEKQVGVVHLLQCFVQQNRQDGIKTIDYNVMALGCSIKGNLASAIRVCNPNKGGECKIYSKSRSADADLIGSVHKGFNGSRYNFQSSSSHNSPQLLNDLINCQMLQIKVEMIQLSTSEPLNLNASQTALITRNSLCKNSEKKLIHQLESQRSIIEQREPRKPSAADKKGFFSFLKCCTSSKPQVNNNSQSAKNQRRPPPQAAASSQAVGDGLGPTISQTHLNFKPENTKQINKQ